MERRPCVKFIKDNVNNRRNKSWTKRQIQQAINLQRNRTIFVIIKHDACSQWHSCDGLVRWIIHGWHLYIMTFSSFKRILHNNICFSYTVCSNCQKKNMLKLKKTPRTLWKAISICQELNVNLAYYHQLKSLEIQKSVLNLIYIAEIICMSGEFCSK